MDNRTEPISEAELRALRDRVFGRPMSKDGWEMSKVNWAKPESLKWLKSEAEKIHE